MSAFLLLLWTGGLRVCVCAGGSLATGLCWPNMEPISGGRAVFAENLSLMLMFLFCHWALYDLFIPPVMSCHSTLDYKWPTLI